MPTRAAQIELPADDAERALEQASLARQRSRWFRKLIRPDMIHNWWTDEVADQLQQFYNDLVAGRRPKLALMTGPQHGKSWAAVISPGWCAGKNPNLKIIFASYSEELGRRTNRWQQRMLDSADCRWIFCCAAKPT